MDKRFFDRVTTLLRAQEDDARLSAHGLSVALVFLAFAGLETTRNHLAWRCRCCSGTPTSVRPDLAVALPLLACRPDAEPDGPGTWVPASGNTGPVRSPIRFSPVPA